MRLEGLSDRETKVFLSIVHGFIQTAEPVGSRFIAKNYDLDISSATVRNVMMDLEEKGLISQPHTSAGRVPTIGGYRQYVDGLRGVNALSEKEKHSIIGELAKFSEDLDQIILRASNVLSQISSQLGIVLAPRFQKGRLNKIELVSLANDKILVILSVKSGLVKTIIVEIQKEVSPSHLHATTQLLNERLHNMSIDELQSGIDERFNDIDDETKWLLDAIRLKTDKIVNFNTENDFHFSGAKNVINQPEFESKEKVEKILELLDRKDILVRVLDEQNTDGVSIVIGSENKEVLMKNCSLITTTYSIGNDKGTLGVIGPTRMQYAKMISLVQFMAETLSFVVSKSK